jgi:hypothetical protein
MRSQATAPGERMTYVEWHEKPEHTTHATVSKPLGNAKALAKQALEKQSAEAQEIEYAPDEHLTNIRITGARRRCATEPR